MPNSLFRRLQNKAIMQFAKDCQGLNIVELGGTFDNNNANFFQNFKSYLITNIDIDICEKVEDVTNLSFKNDELECIICISVLQHVFEIDKAISEIIRVLKPGCRCLITTAFMFPVCMKDDFYRLTPAYWNKRLTNENVQFQIFEIGNIYSSIDNLLMRPYGKYTKIRLIINKLLTIPFKLIQAIYKRTDSSPLGVALIITKNKFEYD